MHTQCHVLFIGRSPNPRLGPFPQNCDPPLTPVHVSLEGCPSSLSLRPPSLIPKGFAPPPYSDGCQRPCYANFCEKKATNKTTNNHKQSRMSLVVHHHKPHKNPVSPSTPAAPFPLVIVTQAAAVSRFILLLWSLPLRLPHCGSLLQDPDYRQKMTSAIRAAADSRSPGPRRRRRSVRGRPRVLSESSIKSKTETLQEQLKILQDMERKGQMLQDQCKAKLEALKEKAQADDGSVDNGELAQAEQMFDKVVVMVDQMRDKVHPAPALRPSVACICLCAHATSAVVCMLPRCGCSSLCFQSSPFSVHSLVRCLLALCPTPPSAADAHYFVVPHFLVLGAAWCCLGVLRAAWRGSVLLVLPVPSASRHC